MGIILNLKVVIDINFFYNLPLLSNIIKIYLKVLEFISSLNCDLEFKSNLSRNKKIKDLDICIKYKS
jgi:hypothetical protein